MKLQGRTCASSRLEVTDEGTDEVTDEDTDEVTDEVTDELTDEDTGPCLRVNIQVHLPRRRVPLDAEDVVVIIAVVVVVRLIDTTAASSPNRQRDYYCSGGIYHEQDPYLTACLQDTGVVPNILIDF